MKARLSARAVSAAVAAALAVLFLSLSGPPLPSLSGGLLSALQSLSALVALGKAFVLHAGWTGGWFVAIGASLAGLSDASWKRTTPNAWLVAYVLLAMRDGSFAPSPLDVLLAFMGTAFGTAMRLDVRARTPKRTLILGIAVTAFFALLIALALAPFRSEAALAASAPSTSEARRSLAHLVDGMDPRKVPDGETRTLEVSATQLDQLVAWAADASVHARTLLTLRAGGVEAAASLPLPRTRRWLELWASADVSLVDRKLVVEGVRAQIGWLYVPSWVLALPVRWMHARLERDRDVQAVLSSVHALSLRPDAASVTYSHVTTGGGLAARLAWGGGASAQIRESTEAQIAHLLRVLEPETAGDLTRALRESFQLAAARSVDRSPLQENRAALMALGTVFGAEKVLRALGERASPERIAAITRVRDATTLRGRNDWTRHFAISGAVTVLSSVAPSNAVGLLKEELDADGGSGFSFADLLADRAGTALAERATQDDASARAMQKKLAALTSVDAYFPPADGLPEGMQDADFQRDYGGVGGARYNELVAEIHRRVAALYAR